MRFLARVQISRTVMASPRGGRSSTPEIRINPAAPAAAASAKAHAAPNRVMIQEPRGMAATVAMFWKKLMRLMASPVLSGGA